MAATGTGRGLVVVLNGPSSSGKTSIARALPAALGRAIELVSVDAPLSLMPRSPSDAFIGTARWARAIADDTALGIGWPNVVAAIGVASRHAERGQVAVVDVVVTHARPAAFVARSLQAKDLLVGVRCSLDELQRRERRRPTRRGLAAKQFPSVHDHLRYDVVVDTTEATVEGCATAIAAAVLARLD